MRQKEITNDSRAVNAKCKRDARQDPKYCELENARHWRGSNPADRFPGTTAQFEWQFKVNWFGIACVVCDRFLLPGELNPVTMVTQEQLVIHLHRV